MVLVVVEVVSDVRGDALVVVEVVFGVSGVALTVMVELKVVAVVDSGIFEKFYRWLIDDE